MPEGKNAHNVFLETLDWICGTLDSLHIPYMITGGSAVGFWGHIRTTMDIDIVIQIRNDQVDAFLESIRNEAYVDSEEAKGAVRGKATFNIIPHETLFKVDIIPLDENSDYERRKFERKIKMDFQGRAIYIISPEDLILSKLMWSKHAGGSERQVGDCESIWKMNQGNIDRDYIQSWVDALKIRDEFSKLERLDLS